MSTERVVHCWKGRLDWTEETYGIDSKEYAEARFSEDDATCLLLDGHEGPHEWTSDGDIRVTFRKEDA